MNFVVDTISMKPEITRLGYDATQSSPRRRSMNVSTKSEDRELTVQGRQALSSQGRDLLRNLAIAGFAIRKSIQYSARFDFKCSIPDAAEYNDKVKRYVYQWSRRENCDLARRHSLSALTRLVETHRIIDGDIGIVKHANGRLQLIESDRIRNPPENTLGNGYEWIHGVKVGNNNQAFRYAIHKRGTGGGFTFEREISSENMILCGYFNRTDQIRGVAPLAPAINQFRDIYEGIEYALAKAKLCQLLGLVTKCEDDPNATVEENEEAANNREKLVKEKFGSGTLHIDLGREDDAQILQDSTPSNQFQDFMQAVIRIALSALDIPYSFYDESLATFYGTRGAFESFLDGCKDRQEILIDTLHELTDWRLRMAIIDGELPPPPNGMSVDEMLWYCDWVGARMPIWKLIEDIKGFIAAIQCGIITPQRIAGMYGMDFDENIIEIAQALDIAHQHGVSTAFETPANIGV